MVCQQGAHRDGQQSAISGHRQATAVGQKQTLLTRAVPKRDGG